MSRAVKRAKKRGGQRLPAEPTSTSDFTLAG
jgi:hypothetical protein